MMVLRYWVRIQGLKLIIFMIQDLILFDKIRKTPTFLVFWA
jgi:hypothetical protein